MVDNFSWHKTPLWLTQISDAMPTECVFVLENFLRATCLMFGKNHILWSVLVGVWAPKGFCFELRLTFAFLLSSWITHFHRTHELLDRFRSLYRLFLTHNVKQHIIMECELFSIVWYFNIYIYIIISLYYRIISY